MRRRTLGLMAAGLLLAAVAITVLVSQLGSRDRSSVGSALGPGRLYPDLGDRHLSRTDPVATRYASNPPTSGAHHLAAVTRDGQRLDADQLLSALEAGNVVLAYSDSRLSVTLRRLADAQAGPFGAALAAAGQAVILDPDPHAGAGTGVVAAAWRHLLVVPSAGDSALAQFVQSWLGRGAPGSRSS